MADTQVMKHEAQAVRRAEAPETERFYVPRVDICEGRESVRLVADMPGAGPNGVNVTVENNVLTIEGWAQVDRPDGYALVGEEYGVGKYRRDFTLSDAVNTEGIKARVQHGVLEVTLPKRERAKTKKITIET